MRPMLAVDYDPTKLRLPMFASPKIDGIRGVVEGEALLSRSLKMIPNKFVQNFLAQANYEGFDGELVAGSERDKHCMTNSTSFFMAHDKVNADFTYWLFDMHNVDAPYDVRLAKLNATVAALRDMDALPDQIKILPQTLIKTEAELMAFETECIDLGFEGVILRKIDGHYKYGRSTANEGLLLKVKRFADAEATVTGFVEQMHNTNEKVTNELGRGKRSTHAAGLVGKNTLGALVLCDLLTGATFQCGTGMNDVQRQHIWNNQSEYLGLIWKYKHFPTGAVDLPRHPVSLGPRNIIDMG